MSGFSKPTTVAPPGGVVTHDRDKFTGPGDYTFTKCNTVIIKKTVVEETNVFLPVTPVLGQEYTVVDGKGDASLNNITIDGNGYLINGMLTRVLISDYGSVVLFFDGEEYIVIGANP